MKLRIEIEMDNAAFEHAPGEEAGRILADVAEHLRVDGPRYDRGLQDSNGNRVGFIKVLASGQDRKRE